MKLILVFFLLVGTIFQYAQANPDDPELPSMSLPTDELPSMSLPTDELPSISSPSTSTIYDSVVNGAQYYTSSAYNGLSEYMSIPYSYITSYFITSSVSSTTPAVDTPTMS